VAHARRKVFESRSNLPSHAALLLGLFQRLYDIEDRSRTFTPDDRRRLRQSESLPIWDEIGAYLASDAVANVMPKEPFGQAMAYLRNNIEALRVHLDDGLVPIDNNDTEQLMKQVALGGKNWMFIGSIEAGNRAADLLSIVSSAARNDLDVFVYVKDVLDKLLAGSRDFDAMRPQRLEARASRSCADLPPGRTATPRRGQVGEAGQAPRWPPVGRPWRLFSRVLSGSTRFGRGWRWWALTLIQRPNLSTSDFSRTVA
jgi:hypothetical protein